MTPAEIGKLVDAYQSERGINGFNPPKNYNNYKQGGNNAHKDQTSTGRPPAQNASPAMDKAPEKGPHPFIKADRSRLRCNYCHKSGHDISKCFRLQAGPSAPNSAPKASYKVRRTTIKHCLICGIHFIGHIPVNKGNYC